MTNPTDHLIDPEGQALVSSLIRMGEKSEDAYNTVQAIRKMASENVCAEIRALGVRLDAKIEKQNAKIDSQSAKIDAQNAKIDAQNTRIDSMRWMLGLVIGLLALLLAMGFFAFLNPRPSGAQAVTQTPYVIYLPSPAVPSAAPTIAGNSEVVAQE